MDTLHCVEIRDMIMSSNEVECKSESCHDRRRTQPGYRYLLSRRESRARLEQGRMVQLSLWVKIKLEMHPVFYSGMGTFLGLLFFRASNYRKDGRRTKDHYFQASKQ